MLKQNVILLNCELDYQNTDILDKTVRCVPDTVALSPAEKSLLSKGFNFVPTKKRNLLKNVLKTGVYFPDMQVNLIIILFSNLYFYKHVLKQLDSILFIWCISIIISIVQKFEIFANEIILTSNSLSLYLMKVYPTKRFVRI